MTDINFKRLRDASLETGQVMKEAPAILDRCQRNKCSVPFSLLNQSSQDIHHYHMLLKLSC